MGGTDSYTNAISDIYQDNFGEGIFTGKGIYGVLSTRRRRLSYIAMRMVPEVMTYYVISSVTME